MHATLTYFMIEKHVSTVGNIDALIQPPFNSRQHPSHCQRQQCTSTQHSNTRHDTQRRCKTGYQRAQTCIAQGNSRSYRNVKYSPEAVDRVGLVDEMRCNMREGQKTKQITARINCMIEASCIDRNGVLLCSRVRYSVGLSVSGRSRGLAVHAVKL